MKQSLDWNPEGQRKKGLLKSTYRVIDEEKVGGQEFTERKYVLWPKTASGGDFWGCLMLW